MAKTRTTTEQGKRAKREQRKEGRQEQAQEEQSGGAGAAGGCVACLKPREQCLVCPGLTRVGVGVDADSLPHILSFTRYDGPMVGAGSDGIRLMGTSGANL